MNAPRARETGPTLHAVYRGRRPSELVLVDASGRAILLRGDGLTEEEAIRMAEAAFRLLGGSEHLPPAGEFRLP